MTEAARAPSANLAPSSSPHRIYRYERTLPLPLFLSHASPRVALLALYSFALCIFRPTGQRLSQSHRVSARPWSDLDSARTSSDRLDQLMSQPRALPSRAIRQSHTSSLQMRSQRSHRSNIASRSTGQRKSRRRRSYVAGCAFQSLLQRASSTR